MTAPRLAIALVLVVGTTVLAQSARRPRAEGTPPMDAPASLAAWVGVDEPPLDAATQQALGADQVVNRTYRGPDGASVGLYIASYARQRPGVSIHSPLHCLPGSGWSILSDDVLPVAAQNGHVRRLVAVRDRTRVLIFYWYDIQGRMVANDALSRLYLLHDSVRHGRNGAALVRLVVPMSEADDGRAERQGLAFLRTLAPRLTRTAPGPAGGPS